MTIHTRTAHDRRDLINHLVTLARATVPDGSGADAWDSFARKLVIAWVVHIATDYISATGIPKTKGRMETRTDMAAWDALAHVAEDWPGQPLGMTKSAVFVTLKGWAEDYAAQSLGS